MAFRFLVALLSLVFWLPSVPVLAQGRVEEVEGYAEWRRGDLLVVDGQRVGVTVKTRFKGGKEVKDFAGIPLGYEVKAKGVRRRDGVIEASQIEVKPNELEMPEAKLIALTNEFERLFLEHRQVPGHPTNHRLLVRGPGVDRVRRIAQRLIPPYRDKASFRYYVVEDDEWNAACYPNGMVHVNQGLLKDMNDDELAVILGHEIAHGTHEHSRREKKRREIVEFLSQAGATAAGTELSGRSREAVLGAIGLSEAAAVNRYSREHEDQADRVGLRYAYEGGFDISQAPRVWKRFAEKYPSAGKVQNFFYEEHSLSSVREARLRREITLNYPELENKLAAANATLAAEGSADLTAKPENDIPLGEGVIDLWVDREYTTLDNPLQTELSINDQAVGIYTSELREPVAPYLRPGWNTIAVKTTPQENVTQDNSLTFRIGPTTRIGNRRSMGPVLWQFSNKTDWDLTNGRYVHRLGPERTDVTLLVPVYFAGLEHEPRETRDGDYILRGKPKYAGWNGPVSATVLVNGTPLNTFLFSEREVIITSLLKTGRNDITIVSKRIANAVRSNDIEFVVYGPVQWHVGEKRFAGPAVVEFGSLQGWKQDPVRGSWTSVATPSSDSVERKISLLVKELATPRR